MADNEDLFDVPTGELVAELFRRFEHCAFVAHKSPTIDKSIYVIKWKGNVATVCGLADRLQRAAWNAFDADAESGGCIEDHLDE